MGHTIVGKLWGHLDERYEPSIAQGARESECELAIARRKMALVIALPLALLTSVPMRAGAAAGCQARALRPSRIRAAEPRELAAFDTSDFESWPYVESDFRRIDESMDYEFYLQPRFVTHIDDGAIAALTEYYRRALPPGGDILDVCSSWISHLPPELPYGRVCAVGMNVRELEANKALTTFEARDLNTDPSLPFADASFDAVINAVSVDYMTRPLELFREMHRVLRPGGIAIMSFSNRYFATKAVRAWLEADELGRLAIVANYYQHSAPWEAIRALDLIPLKAEGMLKMKRTAASALLASFASMDPMWAVEARKPLDG